jgi:hypothetical protein
VSAGDTSRSMQQALHKPGVIEASTSGCLVRCDSQAMPNSLLLPARGRRQTGLSGYRLGSKFAAAGEGDSHDGQPCG